MLPQTGRAGAFPIWTLTVAVLVVLSVMMFRPASAESTSLEEGLGPSVETIPLKS